MPATIEPPRSPSRPGHRYSVADQSRCRGALRAGFRYAVDNGADTVVQVDGDGQHPIDQIEALLKHLDAGDFDMVVGSRFAPGGVASPQSKLRRSAIGVLSTTLTPPRRSDDQ